jgi:hypothetical protein
MVRLLVLLIILSSIGVLAQPAGAQEPPTDTPPPIEPTNTMPSIEPTRTPRPDEGTLIVHVINDLNRNGRRDPSEPGLEGWRAYRGCGDAFVGLGPSDASGTMVEYLRYPDDCLHIQLEFAWFPTNAQSQRFHVEPGETVNLAFLVRKVGNRVHRFTGEVIVNGLPAAEGASIDAVIRGQRCGDGQYTAGTALSYYTLYVLSDDDRPGCARDNHRVALTVDGSVAAERTFVASWQEGFDLIVGPAPMRFSTTAPEGTIPIPYVGGVQCGEARAWSGVLLPSNYYRVFVFPDALRSGCGAPGRVVTVHAGGTVILAAPWQEGAVYDLRLTTPVLPDTGSRRGAARDDSLVALAVLAASLSAAAILLGWRLRRSR